MARIREAQKQILGVFSREPGGFALAGGTEPVLDEIGREISEGRHEARDAFDLYMLSRWETIYEQLAQVEQRQSIKKGKGSPPAFLQKFGSVIKEARIGKGLSQKQLALRVGMKQPDISRVEEGKKNMTLFTLIRICKVLGIKGVDIG